MKISTDYTTLTPAYGRDYKNRASVESDFRSGKDFIHQPSGSYCSIRDFEPGTLVQLRYNKQQQVHIIKV